MKELSRRGVVTVAGVLGVTGILGAEALGSQKADDGAYCFIPLETDKPHLAQSDLVVMVTAQSKGERALIVGVVESGGKKMNLGMVRVGKESVHLYFFAQVGSLEGSFTIAVRGAKVTVGVQSEAQQADSGLTVKAWAP